MVKTITLRLPWPPSVNHYYGRSKFGVFLKDPGRLYRKKASVEFAKMGWPRLDGPVHVHLILTPPDRRQRDIDNVRKALYDAISDRHHRRVRVHQGVIPDDANIKADSAEFTEPGEGMVEIRISEYHGETK